jgi:hypothetical protein
MGKLSQLKLRKQAEAQKVAHFEQVLKNTKTLHKNPAKMLELIYKGEVNYYMLQQDSGAQRIGMIFQEMMYNAKLLPEKKKFYELLKKIAQSPAESILADAKIINALRALTNYLHLAIRDIADFEPTSHNRSKQFSQFLRHLFARYYVPEFMDKAFYEDNKHHIQWFIHIGQGQNIRTASHLPIKMTAKMAHYFTQTPEYYTVAEALRYAQVMAMGGNERLVSYILATRLGREFVNESFWETVLNWFVQNPMLDPTQVLPIVDYIQAQKFATREVVRGRGLIERVNPPQPDFSMKGRTVRALLRAVEEWHDTLNRTKNRFVGITWAAVEIPDFEFEDARGGKIWGIYKITQLLTTHELDQEGTAMNHCVGSYAQSCRLGRCSIWSLTLEDGYGKKTRLLTLELDKNRTIVQARGRFNAMPTEETQKILLRWAVKHNLRFSRWIA